MRLTTICNCCGAEMGSVDVRERHDPFFHPHSLYEANENDFLKDTYTSPPGEFSLEMTGLLYCKVCAAYPGTTIVLSQVDEITMKEV